MIQDYRSNCPIMGAPVDAAVEECEDVVLDTCSGFLEEDCDYLGQGLDLDPPDGEISDPLVCQALCQNFQPLGCQYWVFNSHKQSCHLLQSGERRCKGISGPQEPTIAECGMISSTYYNRYIGEWTPR